MQVNAESIPACNSHQYNEKKCKVETAAAPLMQVASIPACNSHQYNEKKCETKTAAAPLMQISSDSIPACTSYECKKRDASQSYFDVQMDAEMSSDPVCSSAGCMSKEKASHPVDYFVPNFGLDRDIIDSQSHEATAAAKLAAVRAAGKAAVQTARGADKAPAAAPAELAAPAKAA